VSRQLHVSAVLPPWKSHPLLVEMGSARSSFCKWGEIHVFISLVSVLLVRFSS